MPVGRDNMYHPEEALHELQIQETILNVAVDVQALLRILVDKEIISRDEVKAYREEVRNSPKYKPALDTIQAEKKGFQEAQADPEGYLRALFKAKMEGKIR